MTASSLSRTILPDALDEEKLLLIKACSSLRLTHEIRTAAVAAQERGIQFVLAVPAACVLSSEVRSFIAEHDIILYRRSSDESLPHNL
jgi:hypothetical protein